MKTTNNQELLFDEICRVKKFFELTPVVTSAGFVPVKLNFGALLSHEPVFRLVTDSLAVQAKKLNFDLVVGTEPEGLPWAESLSSKLKKPFAYVRRFKADQEGELVEGDFEPGQRALLVDEVLAGDESERLFISNLTRAGLKTIALLVIMIQDGSQFESQKQWLLSQGITLKYLFSWQELAAAQKKRGLIPEEIYPYYLSYLEAPDQWQKAKEKHQEYCLVLKHQLNIPLPEDLEDLLKMK